MNFELKAQKIMNTKERSLAVETVLAGFAPLISNRSIDIEKIGVEIPLPSFSEQIIHALCDETITLLQKRTSLIYIDAPIYVVGDIHGNVRDLIRIFLLSQGPPMSRFLFLGDYVDRGPCSISVIALLFAMQLAFPDHVFLIRGNHEFDAINSCYGFYDEVIYFYGNNDLFTHINKAFEYLPISAIINNDVFCVHGGLSPSLNSISQIEAIQRPFKTYETSFIADLLWSDPIETNTTYVRSKRGSGVTFGPAEVNEFLDKFNMKCILRAHQCMRNGVMRFADTDLFTVFSSSNYDEGVKNSCGLIFFSPEMAMKCFSLPPITQLIRDDVYFNDFVYTRQAATDDSVQRPATFNIKLKEINKMQHSSLGIKVKAVSGYNSMLGKSTGRSASNESLLPPLTVKPQ